MKSTLLGDTDHFEVRGLRRVYGTGDGAFEAVQGIDLAVGAGTIVAHGLEDASSGFAAMREAPRDRTLARSQ